MKHRKLSITLVSAFIAALGLSACSDVTAKDNSLITIKGYNGETLDVDATAMFNEYKTSPNGISKFYEAILEVLIRDYFEKSTEADVKSKLVSLKAEAENKVKGKEQDAKSSANTNGTSYDDEFAKILDSNNVEDRAELVSLFLYQLEKKEIEDKNLEKNLSSLTSEYIGFKKTGETWEKYSGPNHDSMLPYHIRHILVKTSAEAKNYTTGEITAGEAHSLNTVYAALANSKNTFGSVAKQWSDDTSSSKLGDAGIMDVSTSFVNEFKLGIYAYDGIYAKTVTGDQTVNREESFGLSEEYSVTSDTSSTVKDQLTNIGLGQVSYEVFERLGDIYDKEKTESRVTVNEGVAKYFPRNVYWNNYLNIHNVFVITDDQLADTGTHYDVPGIPGVSRTGFRHIPELGLGGTTRVLTDEVGRVVVGVRSEYGIHFMIIQRSAFELEGTISSYDAATSAYVYNDVGIDEYYTTKVPGEQGYPKTSEEIDGTVVESEKVTYVNFMIDDKSTYIERAKAVEGNIKGFDPMFDYRIFEDFIAGGQIQIKDTIVKKEIENYIDRQRSSNAYNNQQSVKETWQHYLDMLNVQYEERDDASGLENSKRLVKVTCAINFDNYSLSNPIWKEGGACYYEK